MIQEREGERTKERKRDVLDGVGGREEELGVGRWKRDGLNGNSTGGVGRASRA